MAKVYTSKKLVVNTMPKEVYDYLAENDLLNENEFYSVEGDEIIQPDQNQNDSTKPDYIKNRTHWQETDESGKTTYHPLDNNFLNLEKEVKEGSENPVTAGAVFEAIKKIPTISPYTGEYTATPKISEEITLETKGKAMKDNVTVKKMPQFEVSNAEGGKTLILGDEYYGD